MILLKIFTLLLFLLVTLVVFGFNTFLMTFICISTMLSVEL